MNLNNAIKLLVEQEVKINYCFDSHFIIQLLIEKYSDEYLQFVSNYVTSSQITITAHQQIGNEIAKLCNEGILKQMQCKSWSFNIHHNPSECTLFKKIK